MQRTCEVDGKEAVLHLLPSSDAPARAREFLTGFAQAHGGVARQCLPDGHLVISELVGNAVLHAATPLSVHLTMDGTALELAVCDRSDAPPRLLPPDPRRIGGCGLALVNRVADSWGVRRYGREGKSVWCRLLPGPQAGLAC